MNSASVSDQSITFEKIVWDDPIQEAMYIYQHEVDLWRHEGVDVILDETYPFQPMGIVEDWYTVMDQTGPSQDWFDMELGVTLGDEKINILPLLLVKLLILDEVQIIKNPQTKACQVIQQIKVTHRLCLTGTPMENHLGELWSIFNFLMPGFLGDQRKFAQLFRQPIEKGKDDDRRALLARRVRPFMLRRTKTQVATELPPKIEIIQKIDLNKE